MGQTGVSSGARPYRRFLGVYPWHKTKGITYEDLHPPAGLEFVASAVKDLVEKVTLVDMRYEPRPVQSFLSEADAVGLSVNWRPQRDIALAIAEAIPPGPTVILGGIQVTQDPADFLTPFGRADILVRGDGEVAMREIFLGRPLAEIPGISYRQRERIFHNGPPPTGPVGDLFPDRRLRRYAYRYDLPWGMHFSIDCLMSSRGCAHRCEFCTYRLDATGRQRPWSGRSAPSVVKEVESMDADLIIFTDDNFGQDVRRVEAICDLLISRGVKKNLACEMRIDIARRPDILNKMQQAGFKGLSFGLESCQDQTLRRIRKGFSRDDVEKAFRVFREFHFFLVGYFIVGYVGESIRDVLEIADFAKRLGLDFIGLSLLRAFKHSSLSEKIVEEPGYTIGDDNLVLRQGMSKEGLECLARRIARRFYTPVQILRIFRKCLHREVSKRAFLNMITSLVVTEGLGRKANWRIGRLR